jgi:hypothetical protein
MSRATYCRGQARLCRELAAQLSVPQDVARLRQMADRYDAEADALEESRSEQH